MRALVTGGTGFIGSHVVRALVDDGASVRVLVRPGSDRRALADLPVEIVTGDLAEPRSLEAPLAGVEVLYHVAADYRLWAPDPAVLYRVNVGGTRALLLAAAAAGVARVVYTSSVGTLGLPLDGSARHGGDAGPARGHGGRLQALQVPGGARGGCGGRSRTARRHREPFGAGRPVGLEAHADGSDARGLPRRAGCSPTWRPA